MSAWRSLSAACAPSTAVCPSLRAAARTAPRPPLRSPKPRKARASTRYSPSRRTTTKPRRAALCSIFPPSRTRSMFPSSSTMSPRAQASAARCRHIRHSPSIRTLPASRKPATTSILFRTPSTSARRASPSGAATTAPPPPSWLLAARASSPSPRMSSRVKCTS